MNKLEEWIRKMLGAKRDYALGDVIGKLANQIYQGDTMGYVVDAFVNAEQQLYLIIAESGKLYRSEIIYQDGEFNLGEKVEVEYNFSPVTHSRLTVQRQKDGKYRWFAFPAATAVMNKQAQLDSTALFDSFVNHVQETGEYPYLTLYHLGDVAKVGMADWVARDGFTYLASGLFDDSPLAKAVISGLEREKEAYWGTSIGFIYQEMDSMRLEPGVEIPVFTEGINQEISILPEEDAASLFTCLNIKNLEETRMKQKIKEALVKLTGDESLVDELETQVDSVNRAAEEDNLVRRDNVEEPVDEIAEEPVDEVAEIEQAEGDPVEEQPEEIELSPEAITAIAQSVVSSEAFKSLLDERIQAATQSVEMQELQERVADYENKFAELQETLVHLTQTIENADEEYEENRPARVRTRVVFKPRENSQRSDIKVESTLDLSSIAADTLERMKK